MSSARAQPGANGVDGREGEDDTDEQTGDEDESSPSRTSDPDSRTHDPVFCRQEGRLFDVAEHVDGHAPEPQDETGLMREQEVAAPGTRCEEKQDARSEEDDREHRHEWTEESKGERWWTFLSIVTRAGVVLGEAPKGARKFHEYRWNEQHADEDVQGEQGPDSKDGETFDGEQDEQDQCGRTRESSVRLRSESSAATDPSCAGGARSMLKY